MLKKFIRAAILFVGCTSFVHATIVEFQTSQGSFQVNLFDKTTPVTVDNFLQYIDEQHYTNSVVHRVVPGFVMQGGGFEFNGSWPLSRLEANPSIINEPVYSNVKGTIAMAKVGGNPNSATDQWFFNLVNNDSNLDVQNGGFTVFGQVIGDGMTIIEQIAQLTLCNSDSLQNIPMVIADSRQCSDLITPGLENFVVINQIIIIDSSEVTDADLAPVKNTLISPSDSSGGSFYWLLLLSFFTLLTKTCFVTTNTKRIS